MNTTRIDFFAPLVPDTVFGGSHAEHEAVHPPFVRELEVRKAFQLDPADRFTYIIMGLAVLIAVVVPLLNLD